MSSGAPRLICGEGAETVNGGRSHQVREDTHLQHTHTQITDNVFRVMSKAADEQSMSGGAAGLLMGLR